MKGNLPDLDVVAGLFGLGLGQTDAANLGMAVGCVGNVLGIDGLALLAGNFGYGDDAFHRADVGQLRRPQHDVADGVDAGLGGLHPAVGLDEAPVGLDLGSLQAEVLGARLATDRDQDFLGFDLLLLAIHAEVLR